MKPITPMKELDPKIRQTNFDEVAQGYTLNEALLEASRCLDCNNPACVKACPVEVEIPSFISLLLQENIEEAYNEVYSNNILPAICGRVCPQEVQCEGACVLSNNDQAIAIGALERFIGDYALKNDYIQEFTIKENNIKIAIVGSGPAGLANAAAMRRLGYTVDVYEALHEYGGVLQYGIPDFRLPKDIVSTEINRLKTIGVTFHKNVIIGKSITLSQLQDEYDYKAIFIGSGAGLPRALNIPGENFSGVYYANEFLTRVNLMKANQFPHYSTPVKIGDNVAVVGGGNVAMDAARTAKRLGANNVFIVYRRDMESLPARQAEIKHAIEEGITFHLTRNPVKFMGKDYIVKQIQCEIMRLGEYDKSNRRLPIGTNTYETFNIDSCIISIGQSPNPILKTSTSNLKVDDWGRIITTKHQTSITGVFAGGDVVSGAATVILAMGAGKDASKEMDAYIQNNL